MKELLNHKEYEAIVCEVIRHNMETTNKLITPSEAFAHVIGEVSKVWEVEKSVVLAKGGERNTIICRHAAVFILINHFDFTQKHLSAHFKMGRFIFQYCLQRSELEYDRSNIYRRRMDYLIDRIKRAINDRTEKNLLKIEFKKANSL